MKVHVTGVETLEVTDPKGLCRDAINKAGVLGLPQPQIGQPAIPGPGTVPWQVSPTPMIPTPIAPIPTNPFTPGTTGDPEWSKKWERKIDPLHRHSVTHSISQANLAMTQAESDEKWGKGVTGRVEPQKWEENWQAKMDAASENTHTE